MAISASEMPGATGCARLVDPICAEVAGMRLDDAHHGAHQPDKWSDDGGGGEPVHVALEFSEFSSLMPSCSAPRAQVRLVSAAAELDLALQFFVAEIEKPQPAATGRNCSLATIDGFHATGLAKGAQEARVGLAARRAAIAIWKMMRPRSRRRNRSERRQHKP